MLAAPYKADLSFLGGRYFQSGSLAHVIIGSLFSCYIHFQKTQLKVHFDLKIKLDNSLMITATTFYHV